MNKLKAQTTLYYRVQFNRTVADLVDVLMSAYVADIETAQLLATALRRDGCIATIIDARTGEIVR